MKKFWIIWNIAGMLWCAFWLGFDVAHGNSATNAAIQAVCASLCAISLWFWSVVFDGD